MKGGNSFEYRIAVECDDPQHESHPRTVAEFLSVRSPRQGSIGLFDQDTPWRLDELAQYGKTYVEFPPLLGMGASRELIAQESIDPGRLDRISARTKNGWVLRCPCSQAFSVDARKLVSALDRLRDCQQTKIYLRLLRRVAI